MGDFSGGGGVEYTKPMAFEGFWNVFLLLLKFKLPGRLFRQIRYEISKYVEYLDQTTQIEEEKRVFSCFSWFWSGKKVRIFLGSGLLCESEKFALGFFHHAWLFCR